MDERLAAAEAALKAGRRADAVEQLIAAIAADPDRPSQVYRVLVFQLYHLGRMADAAPYAGEAVKRFPREVDLWNIYGVILRRLRRFPEALAALETAAKLAPRDNNPVINRGNVLLDMGEGAKAEPVFAKLARQEPRVADHHRQLGRALMMQRKYDPAILRFRQALALKKDLVDAWLDLAGVYSELGREDEARQTIEKGLEANPDHPRLLEAVAQLYRRQGQLRQAEAYLTDLLPRLPDAAWVQYQLGMVLAEYDRVRANVHLRRAVELDPQRVDYLVGLIENLERTRVGDEGANINEAYQLAKQALKTPQTGPAYTKILGDVFDRVCAYDELASLGDLKTLGRNWATTGRHTALMKQLSRVQTLEDRYEVLEQHRIWGELAERAVAANPIRRPAKRPVGDKIRVGFMSSDLRNHPVAYFALPLFDHVDRERFELFAYSYYQGQEDAAQAHIAARCHFRWRKDISDREAAQMIADDDLDFLIELGGSTHMNKLMVMAYKPAPLSASWVGYPFSAGLKTIDYLILDPWLLPDGPKLLIEKPLVLPRTWYGMSRHSFRADPPLDARPAFERNGFITFGTANNVYKYGPELFATWAAVLNRVPDSRFLFVRPEGGAEAFRENVLALFARHGVAAERIRFEPVRGRHLPFYNQMDISLDAFPQTGGTTTCESLWMGAPVVTLVGPAVYERLAYSVLMNVGLEELCARTPEAYVEAAVALAEDRPKLAALRAGLRERIEASPLRDEVGFARDFYATIESAVRGQAGVAASSPRAATSS